MNMNVVGGGFQPIYDPTAVQPMRDELVSVGVKELRTVEEVDAVFKDMSGSALLVVNSVCGCAAGGARPGVMVALQNQTIPDHLTTVFAGQDRAATEQARSYVRGFQPSSPCIVLFKDGEVATILERHQIEGRSPLELAESLRAAFNEHCQREGPSIPREQFEKIVPWQGCGSSIPRAEDA
jgi:putative YphP/YqiW family bacilliredoxin